MNRELKTDSLTFTDDLQFHSYLWELMQRATQFAVAKFDDEWVVSWPADSFISDDMVVLEDQYEEAEEEGE